MSLIDTLKHYINPEAIINWGGYPALMGAVFAETGLLVGFFLPGDSLLVTAGVFIGNGWLNPLALPPMLNLLLLNVALIVCAVVGDAVGFAFGSRAGAALFNRDQSRFFRKDHLLATQAFYEKHGGKTIILARFMPFARTFAPIVAGIGKMPYRKFAMWNITGALAWVISMTVLGFVLGTRFTGQQIERVILLIIFISIAPMLIGWLKSVYDKRKARKSDAAAS